MGFGVIVGLPTVRPGDRQPGTDRTAPVRDHGALAVGVAQQ